MSETVRAAVSIRQEKVRYAEVERAETGLRLRRADRRVLDFDAAEVAWGTHDDTRSLGPLADAVGGLVGSTAARTLQVAVHPPQGYSFFVPVSPEASATERRRQLLRQSALVTGARSARELALQPTTVRTGQDGDGEPFEWVHVLAVPSVVDSRMQAVLDPLPTDDYAWTATTQAAAHLAAVVEREGGGTPQEAVRPYTLVVGQYPTHAEFSLLRDREWYHAQYTDEGGHAGNQAYFATGFLNRVGVAPGEVSRLFTYGRVPEETDFGPFEAVLHRTASPIDPAQALPGGAAIGEEDRGAYVPCIGAAIGAFGE